MSEQPAKAFSLEALMKHVSDQKFPPVDKWNPDFCGDIDMRIAVDGTWFYMGTPITRQRMVKLFASVLRKDDDGKTYLVTPVEKIGITIEDAPFVAISVENVGEGDANALSFTTNIGDTVIAGKDNPIRVEVNADTGEPRPYILVRGNLEALINRAVFYELVAGATEVEGDTGTELVIMSAGARFPLGTWAEN
ncbi:MAG: hypothetical protein COB37_08660 [Kordiimonadales bacterium]|nr:MAG: hypothetical protein COB37_08660 [Kordiimonadales bacterium]